jgi:hypothetical protein
MREAVVLNVLFCPDVNDITNCGRYGSAGHVVPRTSPPDRISVSLFPNMSVPVLNEQVWKSNKVIPGLTYLN